MVIRHKHSDILDADLRHIFAVELMTIRRVCSKTHLSARSENMCGLRMGLETALRRVQGKRIADKITAKGEFKMCNCIEMTNIALKEHGLQLTLAFVFEPGKIRATMYIDTEKFDKKARKVKPYKIMVSYCPFCGEKQDVIGRTPEQESPKSSETKES
jgi:hypothetical protein